MNIKVFLKGLLMGFCDIIPGVSGGTIAFITGIYGRLMKAVANIDGKFFGLLLSGRFRGAFKKIDATFLITLFGGILIAIILGSRVMYFLLNNYFVYTVSFFIGLILASLKVIAKGAKFKSLYLIHVLIGFGIGVSFAFLIPLHPQLSLLYVLLGGFVAISAMFLPGISGAFILLIMGLYENMMHALKNFDITQIAIFLGGAIVGALTISRVINYLFKHYKNQTLFFLVGLVAGALSVPIKQIMLFNLVSMQYILMFMSLILGFAVVLLISNMEKSK